MDAAVPRERLFSPHTAVAATRLCHDAAGFPRCRLNASATPSRERSVTSTMVISDARYRMSFTLRQRRRFTPPPNECPPRDSSIRPSFQVSE